MRLVHLARKPPASTLVQRISAVCLGMHTHIVVAQPGAARSLQGRHPQSRCLGHEAF